MLQYPQGLRCPLLVIAKSRADLTNLNKEKCEKSRSSYNNIFQMKIAENLTHETLCWMLILKFITEWDQHCNFSVRGEI